MIENQSAEVPEIVRASWVALDQAFAPNDPVMRGHMAVVRAWLHGQPLPQRSAPDPDENRIAPVSASVPVVYAWTTGTVMGDEGWVAVCEDGELMASHVSSGREFGQRDVHRTFGRVADRYRDKFGGLGSEFYLFVVVPEGKRPPLEVMKANEEWAKRFEAAGESML